MSTEHLNHILARLPPGLNAPCRPRQPTGFRTYNPLAVRGLMSQLSEAEVAGDDTEVRRLLALLHDRRAVPAKAFSFHEDVRPGYFGTFTRSSKEIGPRAPFKKDAVQVDYAYDSGEEWAEEDAGEADDVLDDGGEDEGADDEPDSDLDDWLVDDDEVEEPGTLLGERMSSPGFPDLNLTPLNSCGGTGKRKVKEEKAERSGGGKKRKVVVPLVPFFKGPEWETAVGQCAYEPFKAYRMQLFNGMCLLTFTPHSRGWLDADGQYRHPVPHRPLQFCLRSHRAATIWSRGRSKRSDCRRFCHPCTSAPPGQVAFIRVKFVVLSHITSRRVFELSSGSGGREAETLHSATEEPLPRSPHATPACTHRRTGDEQPAGHCGYGASRAAGTQGEEERDRGQGAGGWREVQGEEGLGRQGRRTGEYFLSANIAKRQTDECVCVRRHSTGFHDIQEMLVFASPVPLL